MTFSALFLWSDDQQTVSAQTLYVDINGGGNYTSIQDAINSANSGDTIRVWNGTYYGGLNVYKKINLMGNGTNNTIIRSTGIGDLIYVTADFTKISGFSLIGIKTNYSLGCINLNRANHCQISDNDCFSYYYGIYLYESNYNVLFSNECVGNTNGIYLFKSNFNKLKFNNCSDNKNGIYLASSFNNSLTHNYCSMNKLSLGISGSKYSELFNNTFYDTPIHITGSNIDHWITHEIYINNSINKKPIYFWKNRVGGSISSAAGQIILANCSGINIKNQKFFDFSNSLILVYSKKIIIENNTFNPNSNLGSSINLFSSSGCVIKNNRILNDRYSIYIYYSDYNEIINNSCIKNNMGIWLIESNNCNISTNNCSSNEIGINIGINSKWNSITNNYCTLNNQSGILGDDSYYNNIQGNICNFNYKSGIRLITNAQSFKIMNNTCNNNSQGISLSKSSWDIVKNNKISYNDEGITVKSNSYQNKFENNNISFSILTGFTLDSSSRHNTIIHNNFIKNRIQIIDPNTENNWDYLGEGNYWSDYLGKDNGANNRTAKDGIGDTKLPHYQDNNPFVNRSGWEYPGQPILKPSVSVSYDGYYSIAWQKVARATGYILEEDTNISFDDPNLSTEGWMVKKNKFTFFLNKTLRKNYYYRVRAVNDQHIGDWSNVVNITVEYIPATPANLTLSVYPKGNAINISWTPNVKGTERYIIQSASTSTWQYLVNLSHPTRTFDHAELINGLRYYYRICAQDQFGQCSPYSETISAVPLDSVIPKTPTGLKTHTLSDHEVLLTWDSNKDSDLAGYELYIYPPISEFAPDDFELFETLLPSNTSYYFSNLTEQVTYYFKLRAFDEEPNYSNFSSVVNATPIDETHPSKPTGLEIIEITYNSVGLIWNQNPDQDLVGYLVFRSTSLSGPYIQITPKPISDNFLVDKELNSSTIYYYKIKAVDDAGLESLYSDFVYGITLKHPLPPVIKNYPSALEIYEDEYNNTAINLYEFFEELNEDELKFRATGNSSINVNIYQQNGTVGLYPKHNWNGIETITFFAANELYEVSINISIIVMAINDPPKPPNIISPSNGFEIESDQSLDFRCTCTDPDLDYGDNLYFFWSSNIDGPIGEGKNVYDVTLSAGQHLITLEVFDEAGETSNSTIYVSVLQAAPEKKDDGDGPEYSTVQIIGILTIIILQIILIIFVFWKRSGGKLKVKDKEKLMDEDDVEE
jgi:parallel beta-helix repeat protein